MRFNQSCLRIRISALKAQDQTRHNKRGKGYEAAYSDGASNRSNNLACQVIENVCLMQKLLYFLQESLAARGQGQSVGVAPNEQLNAELFLEMGNSG